MSGCIHIYIYISLPLLLRAAAKDISVTSPLRPACHSLSQNNGCAEWLDRREHRYCIPTLRGQHGLSEGYTWWWARRQPSTNRPIGQALLPNGLWVHASAGNTSHRKTLIDIAYLQYVGNMVCRRATSGGEPDVSPALTVPLTRHYCLMAFGCMQVLGTPLIVKPC